MGVDTQCIHSGQLMASFVQKAGNHDEICFEQQGSEVTARFGNRPLTEPMETLT
jgi:hypothetical protein